MATGWEEPSPESIRRRMEIDDGTAAWGDPGKIAQSTYISSKRAVRGTDQNHRKFEAFHFQLMTHHLINFPPR